MIRRLADDELGALQPMFEEVFKHPISLELLQWKYAGQRGESWVSADANGSIVMHCGVSFRTVMLSGEKIQAAQLMDLMAPPKAKGLTRHASPFTTLMQEVLRNQPRPSNAGGVAFGFPSGRAMRLGEHMGVYLEVDRLMELEFAPKSVSSGGARWRELLNIETSDKKVIDALWVEMAKDFLEFSIGVRDSIYLKHRYLDRPEKHYTLLLIEKKGFWRYKPIGLAAIGSDGDRRELLDIVCPRNNIQELIQIVQQWLTKSNIKALTFLLTERFAKPLASFASRCEFTQFRIMGNPFSPASTNARLDRRWWLTGGDTDYR